MPKEGIESEWNRTEMFPVQERDAGGRAEGRSKGIWANSEGREAMVGYIVQELKKKKSLPRRWKDVTGSNDSHR